MHASDLMARDGTAIDGSVLQPCDCENK